MPDLDKLAAPKSLKRALAAITSLLGATAVKDTILGGNLQVLRGKKWPAMEALDAAHDHLPTRSGRMMLARENPIGSLLPARLAVALDRAPVSIATSEAQLSRLFERIAKMPREVAAEEAAKARKHFDAGSPFMVQMPSSRLPAPPGGGQYVEGILGGPARMPKEVFQHELGHFLDLAAGGPNMASLERAMQSPRRQALEAFAESKLGPLHQRRTMASERAAWGHVSDSPAKGALEDAALGTYQSAFHSDRAPTTVALAALSAALLGGTVLKERRDAAREAEMEDHEKLGFDPLTAGTLGVMLPAAILRSLGAGGYAGKLSRGTGWRRPVISATDAAVNRAAEGAGDLAMATASLNWMVRKSLAAVKRKPAEETPALEDRHDSGLDEWALGAMPKESAAQPQLNHLLAVTFDDELEKLGGLFGKMVNRGVKAAKEATKKATKATKEATLGTVVPDKPLVEIGRPLMAAGTPKMTTVLRAVEELKASPGAKDRAKALWSEFRTNKTLREAHPEISAVAPLHLSGEDIERMGIRDIGKMVTPLVAPGMTERARSLAVQMVPEFKTVISSAFFDEVEKLAGVGFEKLAVGLSAPAPPAGRSPTSALR